METIINFTCRRYDCPTATQAKEETKSLYLIDQYKVHESYENRQSAYTFKYDRYGRITKTSYKDLDYSFKYDKKGNIKSVGGIRYKTNKLGLVVSQDQDERALFKYNNQGLMTSWRSSDTGGESSYNKKGQLVKYFSESTDVLYHYDRYGMVTKTYDQSTIDYSAVTKISYTRYKLPSKFIVYIYPSVGQNQSSKKEWEATYTFKYTKVKVKTKYMKEVKRQQDALLRKKRI